MATNEKTQEEKQQLPQEGDGTMNFLKRSFNALNEQNINTKRAASTEILNFIQSKKYELDSIFMEQIMTNFGKQILKALSDNVDKVRENSIKLLNFLLSRCQDFTPHLPLIISVLVERTNCNDLEGIQDLPEVMRPVPSQKPQIHVKLAENVEEIRVEYSETIATIISCCNEDEIRDILNDVVNILRALSMDPCREVQVKACQNISLLCRTFTNLLLHFSEMLARALLLPLVSKKSKVRIAALEALGQVLYCGVWKYNNNIMEVLVGFRDPNSVPLNDFFEYSTRINYFAILIKDPKTNVREFFIRCLGDWLISLPDRGDHEPRLIPYLVSGLFDSDEEISLAAYEIIEEVGLQYEREKEKELRPLKQFGYDSEWTQGGKVTQIKLPKPFTKRPRLGSRHFIRNHVRKFLPALYKEVKDWHYENRLEAINLLLYGVIYAEDYMTQFLDKFLVNILHNLNVRTKEDQLIADKTCQILYYIGVFCPYTSYLHIIKSVFRGEVSEKEDFPKYALIAIVHLLQGFFETVLKEQGLNKRKEFIHEIIETLIKDDFLSTVEKENALIIEQIMEVMLESLLEKGNTDDLEAFYRDYRFKAEMISYTALRYRLLEFERLVSKKDLELDYKPELNTVIGENRLVKAWKKFDDIFEDLLLDSFIETFQSGRSSFHLSFTEWKMIFAYFLTNISLRASQGSKYDDNLLKTLGLIKEIDLNEYGKVAEVLHMNILIIKMIADCFTDEELTKGQSLFLFNAIDINCKVYHSIEKTANKVPGLQDKLLLLNKIFFCKNIVWVNAVQKLEGKTDPMKELVGNIAELVHLLQENNLRKQEDNAKEFKKKLVLFKTILAHLGPLILKKSRYLKTKEKKYLVPELIDYLLFLHEKFVNNDEEDVLPVLFEALFMILMTIPEEKANAYKGDEWIVPDYSKLLERIIVLAIDTKDNETREKYKTVLKSLAIKTPFNILDQWERAVKSQSIPRAELIASLKKHIEGL